MASHFKCPFDFLLVSSALFAININCFFFSYWISKQRRMVPIVTFLLKSSSSVLQYSKSAPIPSWVFCYYTEKNIEAADFSEMTWVSISMFVQLCAQFSLITVLNSLVTPTALYISSRIIQESIKKLWTQRKRLLLSTESFWTGSLWTGSKKKSLQLLVTGMVSKSPDTERVSFSRQDMWRIAQYQLRLIGMCMPPFFRQYISLWRVFEAEQDRRGRKELFAKVSFFEELLEKYVYFFQLKTFQTYLGKMSEYYGIDSVGRAHNANDDCKTLGLIAQKMFQTGATVSINEVLVCYAVVSVFYKLVNSIVCFQWRRKPLILPAGWRNSFRETSKVFERVMPLVVKAVRPSEYKPNEYGVCKYCKAPYQKCGSTHRQFPHDLYVMESDPIEFAELANYNFPWMSTPMNFISCYSGLFSFKIKWKLNRHKSVDV